VRFGLEITGSGWSEREEDILVSIRAGKFLTKRILIYF
jgi:hypothetical protein